MLRIERLTRPAPVLQEFMRALQCFMYEFWDLETRTLEEVVADREATEGLLGGWCVLMPEAARICHVRRCCPRPPCCLIHIVTPAHG